MAAFRPEALVEKLGKLNATQQSIETISQWCIFFRKDAKSVVATWESEYNRANDANKKLAMVYLANDILQNSRKKGPQFVHEFYHKLPPAIHQLLKHGDERMRRSITRMIKVWEERRVFGSSGAKPFTDLLADKAAPSPSGRRGNIVLEAANPTVERLSTSIAEAAEAHQRCRALSGQCSAALSVEEGSGSADSLASSMRTLQQYTVALQNEIGHRDKVLSLLQQLAAPHEGAKQAAEEQLGVCQLRVHNLQQRLREAGPEAVPSASGEAEQASVAQPPQNGEVQPPVNVQHSPALVEPPPDATGNGGQPSASPAPAAPDEAPAGFSAADLVAQLSQSGTSAQMLLDALAALPKGEQLAEGPPAQDQLMEEYDPELGM